MKKCCFLRGQQLQTTIDEQKQQQKMNKKQQHSFSPP
jgi:hypothetical protein